MHAFVCLSAKIVKKWPLWLQRISMIIKEEWPLTQHFQRLSPTPAVRCSPGLHLFSLIGCLSCLLSRSRRTADTDKWGWDNLLHTAPLKLQKTNHRAQTKFHCRCYLWVCGDQKIWKLKISDEGFLIFPLFWKKNWKKCGKKFSFFFFY